MSLLLVSDLHLTSRRRDAYRLAIFDRLIDAISELGAGHVCILGDVTDAKDRHPSALTNAIVQGLIRVRAALPKSGRIVWLLGNHDCIDPASPFFGFVSELEGIVFVHEPCAIELKDDGAKLKLLLLPHTRDYKRDWPADPRVGNYDLVLTHVTVDGALSESGVALSGIPASYFKLPRNTTTRIFSGDIHVPQVIGDVEYVGAPYRIRFGDEFSPRGLLVYTGRSPRQEDVRFAFPDKRLVVVSSAAELKKHKHAPGTQIKLRVRLPRTELVDWATHKRELIAFCVEREWDLCGIELVQVGGDTVELADGSPIAASGPVSPDEALTEYCSKTDVPDHTKQLGYQILRAL